MDNYALKQFCKEEEAFGFAGWDFSHLKNRMLEEKLPWDYKEIIKKFLKPEHKLLDMGTGGGEFLLTLHHPFTNTSVTEMWEPNVKLCMDKLVPLGVELRQVSSDSALPFADNAFDIILNRHESFDIKEVHRILKPNGLFITQQVGGKNNESLSKALIKDFRPPFAKNTLENRVKELAGTSFAVLHADEYFPYLRFKDLGALVYYAKIIEWEFPGFSVDNCFAKLCELNAAIKKKGYLESVEHRFILVARKQE